MNYDEFITFVDAALEGIDELSRQLFVEQDLENAELVNYHGYVCGYGRALAEFIERGPKAQYWDVYKSFNRYSEDNDRWFHEGLVSGLAACITTYLDMVQ